MRKKITPILIQSRESMASVVSSIVDAKLKHSALINEMEQKILAIQSEYKSELDTLARQIEINESAAYIWSQQNLAEFGDKKSIDFTSATVGFRTSPPKVVPANSKISDKSIARLLEALEWGEPYLNYPDPKPDKEAILADRNKLTPDQLRAAGIKIEQEEIFYIQPKSEIVETSKQAA